jgi:type III restriction enzyme
MAEKKYLYDSLKFQAFDLDIRKQQVPDYILDNVKFPLFDWQHNALVNFLTYQKIKEYKEDVSASHLLFNMATGTGKTLLMASLILYYYNKGYRHFLFFVNQNNIVGKTEDNLTDPTHNKYLFKHPIVIDDKTITINKVDTFSNDTENIEIVFTSIHKLHNDVYKVKENSLFLEDLQKKDLVLLADEAHHLNSDTKAKVGEQYDLDIQTELKDSAKPEDVEKSWEHTVNNLILNRGNKNNYTENRNVLLEFTATIPTNKNIVEKYLDKTIYSFDLKDFLKAGYTKEINLVSSTFDKRKRVLQALLFNWYRYQIGLDYDLPNFKPVILFRSKFVDKTKEENVGSDYLFFREIVDNLKNNDFDFLKSIESSNVDKIYEIGQSRIVDIFKYINANKKINYNTIITYLQDAFQDTNCITTHSQDKKATGRRGEDKTTSEQDKLLNSLEDKQNHITAIFTCQRLTEGWDVLNLYDIVRMYEGQNTGGSNKGKAGKSTVSEVQLIGRGVRYYPFKFEDNIPNKRKFDKALNHELRVLEEFYFHSDKDERYIGELKAELKRQELLPEREKQLKLFNIKDKIKKDKNSFYNQLNLYKNEKLPNPNKRKRNLIELKEDWSFIAKIEGLIIDETKVNFDDGVADETRYTSKKIDNRTIHITFNEAFVNARNILFKAYHIQSKKDQSLFRFNNLKEELSIESIDDIFKNEFIGEFRVSIIVPSNKNHNNLTDLERFAFILPLEKVRILTEAFTSLETEIKKISNPYIGSDFEAKKIKDYFGGTKTISVVNDPESDYLEKELIEKDWYALDAFYGTSEEKGLITFLKDTMDNFKDKYKEVNLLRNEEVYKIYDFKTGQGFMPDFILFLKSEKENLFYQVFIEPKGDQFKASDAKDFKKGKESWKEDFMADITLKYGVDRVLKSENKNYRLIGLPLYNMKSDKGFKEKVVDYLSVEV